MLRPAEPLAKLIEQDSCLKLLLACCRADLGLAEPAELERSISAVNDWERFKRLADRHGLVPLVHQWLTHSGADAPSNVLAWLEEQNRAKCLRALAMTRELLRLIDRFEAAGIPTIAFKGPVLSQQLYGQVARRDFLDLDLLVREEHALAANEILVDDGYCPRFNFDEGRFARYCAINTELSWHHRAKGVSLDLHWALVARGYSFTIPECEPWEDPQDVAIAGREVRTLHPHLLMNYLLVHHSGHGWGFLIWLLDLARLLRGMGFAESGEIHTQTDSHGTKRMTRLGLYLISFCFDLRLPDKILAWIAQDKRVPKLALRALRQITADEVRPRRLSDFVCAMDSRADVICFWERNIIEPTHMEWQIIDLPKSLRFIYYPLRILRLFAKRVPLLLSAIRK